MYELLEIDGMFCVIDETGLHVSPWTEYKDEAQVYLNILNIEL